MSVLLVKTTDELTALEGTAGLTAGDTYFNSDTKDIRVWAGSNWRIYNSDSVSLQAIANTTSVSLDGVDDHVLIPSHSSYGFGIGDFTIICWFNADTMVNAYNALWDFRPNGSGIFPSFFIGTANNYKYYYNAGTSVINYNTSPNLNTWYMNAVVRQSGEVKVYLNDQIVANGTDNQSFGTPTAGIKLGSHASDSSSFDYDGYLDEFAIFDTALNQARISSIYNNGTPVSLGPIQPLTWLRLGDGDTGTTVTDHGTLENHASLVNNATFSTTTAP